MRRPIGYGYGRRLWLQKVEAVEQRLGRSENVKRVLQHVGRTGIQRPLCDLSIKHGAKVIPIEGAAALRYHATVCFLHEMKFMSSNLCYIRERFRNAVAVK